MYRPPPNNQQYYSAPSAQVPTQTHWSATGAQFQHYHSSGPTTSQGVFSGGMQGYRPASQMLFQQSPGLHGHGQVQGAAFQQVQGPLGPQPQAYQFQQAYTAPFHQVPTRPFQQAQRPMFQQAQTSQFQQAQTGQLQQAQTGQFQQAQTGQFQQAQTGQFQQAQMTPFQQIPGQPTPQAAHVATQSHGMPLMGQIPPYPQGQPQQPSPDILKKKEKERLFREQQQRLKFTGITKTAKNPLDNLFGSQTVSQVTQGRESPHVVQSSSSDDQLQLSGTTLEGAEEQLPTSHQPAEATATATVEPSKPSGREVLEKLLAESLDDLSQSSPSTKKRAQFKPTKAMFAPPASKATFVQSVKARSWENSQQFTGVFAEQADDDFGEFSSADPGLATVQESQMQQCKNISVQEDQQQLSTLLHVSQSTSTSAGHLHLPTEQTIVEHLALPTHQPQNPTGQSQLPTGQSQFPAGQSQFPAGQSKFPAGQPQLPTGLHQFPASSAGGTPCTTGPGITLLLASSASDSTFGTTAMNSQQPQVVQSVHPPIPSVGQQPSALPLMSTLNQTGKELRQPTVGSSTHQDDWGSFTSFQDKPSATAATGSFPEGAQKEPFTHKEPMGVSDTTSAPSVPGSWISSFSTLPMVYHDVKRMASLSDSIFLDTKTLSTIFASSGVSRPVLRDIWSEVSQTYRGKLLQDEMVMALALIALAQSGVKELKREALLNLPQAPIPQLSAVHSTGVSVAASKGGSVQPPQPPQSVHPASLHQPTDEGDSDDFGAFQASSSFPVQKEAAPAGEPSHLLQPVQLQKPMLPPGLITTPPTAADSVHTAVSVPSCSTGWTTSAPHPEGTHVPKQQPSSAGDSAQVAASTVPLIPSEVDQTSDDRYAAFRELSASIVDTNAPGVESPSNTKGGEVQGVSHYVMGEHKEQTAETTGLFSEPNKLEQCLKVCHSLLQTALEAMTIAPPAALDEVLATSHGQEKIKGLYEVYKLVERLCDSGSRVDHSRLAAIRKQWTQLIGLNPGIALVTSAPHPLPEPTQDSSCAICKSQGPLPCVRNTVEVGGATCHVSCINFWYTFMSE